MKCSLDISNLMRSLVFPILLFSYFWSLRKAFLLVLAVLWNSAFRWIYLSVSPLPFASLLFSDICKAFSDNHSASLHFFFLVMVSITASCTIGFPHNSVGKESACNAGDPSSIPGSGRSTGERTGYPLQYSSASLVAQLVRNAPAMRETWVQSLGWEDRLEKGKATHSSILAWRILWTVSPWGRKESYMTEQLSLSLSCTMSWTSVHSSKGTLSYQQACLENPMNSMKRQKDRTLKDELPRSVGARYATGEEWRNSPRKNDEVESKQKQHPVVDVTGDGSKVGCCKEQYCIGTWNVRFMNQGKLEVVKQEMARVNIDILGMSELIHRIVLIHRI